MYSIQVSRLITFNQKVITKAKPKANPSYFLQKQSTKAKCQNLLFFLSLIGMLVKSSI